jgi:hypothetical protein
MKVTFTNVAASSYANITIDAVELCVRLPNHGKKPAQYDLRDLADAEDLKAKNAQRRAERLRRAADFLDGEMVEKEEQS